MSGLNQLSIIDSEVVAANALFCPDSYGLLVADLEVSSLVEVTADPEINVPDSDVSACDT